MTYIPSVKFLAKFDDTSLFESVSQTFLVPIGDQDVEVLDNGTGYIMKKNQYLEGSNQTGGGFELDISSEFVIGFWLYSINPGMVDRSDTGGDEIESVKMPIIEFVSYDGSNVSSVINIYESTHYNNENSLTVDLNDRSYVEETPFYEVGMWHYFWIVYSGDSLYIYIDGSLKTSISQLGVLPSSIDASVLNIYINRNLSGYSYNKIDNGGYLDDLVVLNTISDIEGDLQKIINYSVDYLVDSSFQEHVKNLFGILFNDPSTYTINSMVSDMSYVYVSRNDGKILRGSSLLWESRKEFSDSREADLLNEDIIADGGKASEMVNNMLKITDSVLRL